MSMIRRLENEIMQLQGQSMSADASNTSPGPIEIDEKENDPVSGLICMDDYNIDDILRSNDLEVIAKEVRAMAKKMSAQKSHNAELLTRILKLQGNIQVCCRIRPMTAGESQQGLHEVALSLSETEVGCFDERTRSWKSFAFDKVWGPESRQKDVFQDVEPLALSVIDGYNACIFAYGQSGYIFSLFLFLFMLVIYAMNILTIFFIRAKQLEVGRHLQWKAASWTINTVSVRGRSRKSSVCCKRRLSSTSEITGTGNHHHYSTIRLKSVC
jgi:hypothetical protein